MLSGLATDVPGELATGVPSGFATGVRRGLATGVPRVLELGVGYGSWAGRWGGCAESDGLAEMHPPRM